MISLHSYLVYTYEQQIFIDEVQVYSRRHIQLSSTHAHSGGQPSIFLCCIFFIGLLKHEVLKMHTLMLYLF
jgi:hypothetical protein